MNNSSIHSSSKSPLNEWVQFAQEIVEKACILDDEVASTLIKSFSSVPRERFVEGRFRQLSLSDCVLPISYGQTLSQPSLIARMLGLIGLKAGMRILEVGCGSGYVSALMAAAGAQVYGIEGVGLLAQRTRHHLDLLSFQNVLIRRGEGRKGWAEHAPYDAIVVSTPFDEIEPELISQLKTPGGRLIAPIGNAQRQTLTIWHAKVEEVTRYQLEPCDINKDL